MEWQPFPSPGDIPNPGTDPKSPTLQADSLQAESQQDSIPGLGRSHTEGNKEYFNLKCYVQKFQLHLLDSV